MSDTPPATSALGRLALGAVGLVVAAAVLFAIIGAVSGDGDDAPSIADPPTTEPDTPDSTATADATDATDEPSTPDTSPSDASSPAPTASDTPTEEASSPAPTDVDPASVSVQVLDAVIDDGGAAAGEIADRMSADGYRVVAENRAVRTYDQTTVFYTEGNEDVARQIAATYGFEVVEPAPDNLSTSVAVHVVVGLDDA